MAVFFVGEEGIFPRLPSACVDTHGAIHKLLPEFLFIRFDPFPRWFHFTISVGMGHMRRRIPEAIVPRDCLPASGVGRKAGSAVLRLAAHEGFRNDHQGDGESSAAAHCEPQMDLIDPDPQGHVARLETRSKSASLPRPAKNSGAEGCRASRYEMHNMQSLVR